MIKISKKILLLQIAILAFLPAISANALEDTFEVTQVVTSGTTPTPSTTAGPGGSGPQVDLRIIRLLASPSFTSANVLLETNLSVIATISWGRDNNYEIGSIQGTESQRENNFKINNLLSNTRYYFKLVLIDEYGRVHIVDNQFFTTLFSTVVPENILNFAATPDESSITLTWENPKASFESVRILRSEGFFPRDPYEGVVIYEGSGEVHIDRNVVTGIRYYYTAFTRDNLGNFSSGALADAALLRPGEVPEGRDLFGGILLLPKEQIHPLLRDLTIHDVDFIQEGKKLPMVDGVVDIRGDLSLKISIDYEKVPEILKTIVITLYDPEDSEKSFSFLLRVNEEKTAYEAIVASLDRPGKYSFGISILDHKNQGLVKMAGVIAATIPNLFSGTGTDYPQVFSDNTLIIILVLFLILVFMIILSHRKREKRSDITLAISNTKT